jgi:hypothetical protein
MLSSKHHAAYLQAYLHQAILVTLRPYIEQELGSLLQSAFSPC